MLVGNSKILARLAWLRLAVNLNSVQSLEAYGDVIRLTASAVAILQVLRRAVLPLLTSCALCGATDVEARPLIFMDASSGVEVAYGSWSQVGLFGGLSAGVRLADEWEFRAGFSGLESVNTPQGFGWHVGVRAAPPLTSRWRVLAEITAGQSPAFAIHEAPSGASAWSFATSVGAGVVLGHGVRVHVLIGHTLRRLGLKSFGSAPYTGPVSQWDGNGIAGRIDVGVEF